MLTFAQSDKIIVWKGLYLNTIEHCKITKSSHLIVVHGQISGLVEHQPINIHYSIELNEGYEINSVQLQSFNDPFAVDLSHKNKKWFDLYGNHLSQYDDCDDIDIALTPYTNTIPIKRLKFNLGDPREINVIYIDPLKKMLTRTRQRYTHIENRRYKYENIPSGFVSNIYTDNDGIVDIYPGIWQMIYPEKHDLVSKSKLTSPWDFASALISIHPSPELEPNRDIYARLLGNWNLKITDYYPENQTKRHNTGVWYFSRTLEGRGIQDVLISPDFNQRSESSLTSGNRYGTSFRMMDPISHQWTIDWFNPVSGMHDRLIARVEGNRIIQETPESDGLKMRWIFDNITEESFHWYGEDSNDHGKTWVLSAEFFASKINL
jgi:uncharacterized protein